MLESLRFFLLITAFASCVLSTVLFRVAGRPFINWYLGVFRFPVQIQRLLANDRLVHVWGLGSSGLSLVVWWYLGTLGGQSAFGALMPQRMP
jgi:hypothetical protein